MDSNEKKGKRPRIGARPISAANMDSHTTSDFEQTSKEGSQQEHRSYGNQGYNSNRPYQQRPYNNRQGGYQNNRYNNQGGGYQNNRYNNRQGGYQQRPYAPQTEGTPTDGAANESASTDETTPQATGYQPRNNYNRQGGYQQGGYQPRNNYNRQGGYGNNNRQGGYQPRGAQGGYGNNNRQGGYQQRGAQGGYGNNNRQGGYGNKGPRQNQFGMPQGGRSFTPRPKRVEYEMEIPDPNEQIRLNKYMANAGLCSRREADEYILQGLIKVNGNVVTELGTKISHSDVVEYDEKIVALEKKCYILLNKPKDCVTTSDDPNGRLTVMDLVKG
ncbi:MAG: pseudouridine synthase, partial [Duncaniella sp.]|nr:pseudouridine synthase [Duncaniella sp.]